MPRFRALTALLMAGLLPLTGCQTYRDSCLTHKLWSDPSLTDRNGPAGTRSLKAFRSPSAARLQVSYDERREKDSSLQRRAFFLPDSAKALASQGRPSFTNPTPAAGWIEVPVIAAGESAPDAPLYLKLTADHKSFTVMRAGVADGPHGLPTYVDQSSTAFRVAMTPLAVVADLTVVAIFCGIVAVSANAGGQLPISSLLPP